MEKWKQDLLNELKTLDPQEIHNRMIHLKYGDPTSPRHDFVENYLRHLPKPITDVSKNKKWYETPYGLFFLGVMASLLATAIWYFFVRP